MDAYMYKAALYCEPCADEIKSRLAPDDGECSPSSEDSDRWPQGPHANGGGEADAPQICDGCGEWLRNQLTSDGYDYVREMVNEHLQHDRGELDLLNEWLSFYAEKDIFPDVSEDEWSDPFVQAYVECALWSSTDNSDESGGRPLDDNYGPDDIAEEARREMVADCRNFRMEPSVAADLHGMDPSQAGHDFWLTRNGHGAGFWDRGLGAKGDRLSDACKSYGTVDLYVGDDGKVYA